jgi:hypothetical protein
MSYCSRCEKTFTPGATGWMARWEGPPAGVLPDSPLKKVLICPADYAKLKPSEKRAWHEYVDPPQQGATREKRPGRLGAGA